MIAPFNVGNPMKCTYLGADVKNKYESYQYHTKSIEYGRNNFFRI